MILPLIRLNYRFLFNRITTTIVFILNAITVFGMLSASNIKEGFGYIDMYRVSYGNFYFDESFMLIKLTIIIMAIVLTASLSSVSAKKINIYVVNKQVDKYSIFISKLITLFIVMLVLSLFFIIEYLLILVVLTPYSYSLDFIVNIFINQYLQTIVYISITNFLLCILPSLLLSVLPIILFWYMEINAYLEVINSNEILSKLYDYIPNLVIYENQYRFLGNSINYLLFLTIIILGNCLYFVKKDII